MEDLAAAAVSVRNLIGQADQSIADTKKGTTLACAANTG